ncbi:MAG: penicillin acylase family protein, partial [Psychroserpens sp.]|nr:penicillin acylase family protein [Psychroserpens sp.]
NSLEVIKKDPESLKYLQAYSDGVNAYIDQLDPEDYPVEYKLLDYEPEAWSIEKTMHLLMYMTDMLCSRNHDLEFTNVLRMVGKERFDLLFPDFFDVNDPVIPKETDWSFISEEMTETPFSEIPKDTIWEVIQEPHPNNGSNNWAVGPDKSYSGFPILANDPHLGLNLPSIWFVMQLHSPNQNVFGATLPGTLGIIIGFNEDIAWGVTNATRDVMDWYKVEFQDSSRTSYKYGNDWNKSKLRLEEIKIRNKETYIDSVLYTHHGPVTYDHNFKSNNPKNGYAMKWMGHVGHNFAKLFLKLNKATNYDGYLDAISEHVAPAQNFIFASKEGDIALWIQGKFPNKWKDQGKFLLDGSNPDHDWQGYIPREFNAHTKNPERGFVSSANQHPVDPSYPFFVFNDGYETYRNRVINNYLSVREKLTIQDFKNLQNNNFNLKAQELVPFMLEKMEVPALTDDEQKLLSHLRSWNFVNSTDYLAPSIWAAWIKHLNKLTWDEFYLEDQALKAPFMYQTIYLLKNHPNDELMDIQGTPLKETAIDLFTISFKAAAKELEEWKTENGEYYWKDYKGAYVGHLLQALPAFSRLNIPIGGDRNTVNASDVNHGPSWRMIVEMSSPPKVYGVYPGGQSGNPGSKYYDNFIDDWAKGNYYDLLYMLDENPTSEIQSTQTLTPEQ